MECILSTMRLQPNGVAVNISDTAIWEDTLPRILQLFPSGFSLHNAEKLEVYYQSKEVFGFMYSCSGGSLRLGGGIVIYEDKDQRTAAIGSFRYIFQECAQTIKELYIHDYSNREEGYIFDDFSCFNLEKLVLGAPYANIHDRFFEVLNPENPEIQNLPAPRLQSLSIHGLHLQSTLEQLIGLCEARFKMGHPQSG
ncbi:hypothetical protein BJ322DRAFT_1065373 [Thelephora terrestris]|uniref:Uncharacterized protein n=1 Tax=Thelephora terrestris TaxID=56493 RepID=A0A9P6L6P6_9AGAM|nr:hypothetical protein BJ322DRAFT_1065373 [Thelephora terrestris]